ncbi:hypothetical protein E3P92_00468 [Wallemia ichthyophaga]|nr:hypothetical protein E3P94_00674 [Wallemia ichthyophaga]TIB18787.1 hypothetical protein E3P92_00468 [Wallemia ichthyophaga]TIB34634.1 hypothetical protein E3P84_01667 [Wallemia ichthyophaga]TIB41797.1 hypothetical protein E3P83_01616 [Wallemia ichthyophaga]
MLSSIGRISSSVIASFSPAMIEAVIKSKKYIQNLNKIEKLMIQAHDVVKSNQSRCSQLDSHLDCVITRCNQLLQLQIHQLHTRYVKINSIDVHLKSITSSYLAKLKESALQLDAIQLPTHTTHTTHSSDSPFYHNTPSTFSEYVDTDVFNTIITSLHQYQQSLTQAGYSSKNLLRCLTMLLNAGPLPSRYALLDEFRGVEAWLDAFRQNIHPTLNAHLASVHVHWTQLIDADADHNLTADEMSILNGDVDELASIVSESESALGDAEGVRSRSDSLRARYEECMRSLQARVEALEDKGEVRESLAQSHTLQSDIEKYVDTLQGEIHALHQQADHILEVYAAYARSNLSLRNEFDRQASLVKEIDRVRTEAECRINQLHHLNETNEQAFWESWSARSDELPPKLIHTFRGV